MVLYNVVILLMLSLEGFLDFCVSVQSTGFLSNPIRIGRAHDDKC